ETGAAIMALLNVRRDDRTTVIVATHDPVLADAADRALPLRDGRLVYAPDPSTRAGANRKAPMRPLIEEGNLRGTPGSSTTHRAYRTKRDNRRSLRTTRAQPPSCGGASAFWVRPPSTSSCGEQGIRCGRTRSGRGRGPEPEDLAG